MNEKRTPYKEVFLKPNEKAKEAKKNTVIVEVTVEINGVHYTGKVVIWKMNFGEEGEEKDLQTRKKDLFFIEGYGQQTTGEPTTVENYLTNRAEQPDSGISSVTFLSVQNIPQIENPDKKPLENGAIVNAQLLKKALESTKAGVGHDTEGQEKIIGGYSLGSAAAISLARMMEKDGLKVCLNLFSLSGVANFERGKDIKEISTRFATEVTRIVVTQTIKGMQELLDAISKNESPENKTEERQSTVEMIIDKLSQFQGLFNVAKRVLSSKGKFAEFLNDISQVLIRNPDADSFTGKVNIIVPSGDSLYSGIEELQEKGLQEWQLRGITWKNWNEFLLRRLFPRASEVNVRFVSPYEEKTTSDDHLAPTRDPHLYMSIMFDKQQPFINS